MTDTEILDHLEAWAASGGRYWVKQINGRFWLETDHGSFFGPTLRDVYRQRAQAQAE